MISDKDTLRTNYVNAQIMLETATRTHEQVVLNAQEYAEWKENADRFLQQEEEELAGADQDTIVEMQERYDWALEESRRAHAEWENITGMSATVVANAQMLVYRTYEAYIA
jgi:hypothetical protein